jgi:hypothetical protein
MTRPRYGKERAPVEHNPKVRGDVADSDRAGLPPRPAPSRDGTEIELTPGQLNVLEVLRETDPDNLPG